MLRANTIARGLPHRLFDNHVNNVSLHLVDEQPEHSLFCMQSSYPAFGLYMGSCNTLVYVYLRTLALW